MSDVQNQLQRASGLTRNIKLKRLRLKYKTLTWLIPVSIEEWQIIRKYNNYGVTLNHRAIKRIAKGDLLVFYITKTSSKVFGGNIVGVFKVVSDWFLCSDKELPKEECKRYPMRIKIEPIVTGKVDLWSISDKLSFIKRKDNPSYYLKGTPANGNRPIPREDLELIIKLLSGRSA